MAPRTRPFRRISPPLTACPCRVFMVGTPAAVPALGARRSTRIALVRRSRARVAATAASSASRSVGSPGLTSASGRIATSGRTPAIRRSPPGCRAPCPCRSPSSTACACHATTTRYGPGVAPTTGRSTACPATPCGTSRTVTALTPCRPCATRASSPTRKPLAPCAHAGVVGSTRLVSAKAALVTRCRSTAPSPTSSRGTGPVATGACTTAPTGTRGT